MDHESAKKLLCLKKVFSSYDEFKAHFEDWERQTNSVYTIVSSKPITTPSETNCNPALKYSYLRLQCKFGGPRRFRGNGIRKTLTHKMDCPAYVNIKWSPNRQHLVFGNMELQHYNHPQSEEAYTFLRERRNLSRSTRKEADKLLKQRNDANLIAEQKKKPAFIRAGWQMDANGSLEAIEKLFPDNAAADEACSMRNTIFNTEEELLQWIKNYEELSGQKYKTFWSTRITPTWVEKGFTNTAMGYKQVMFICEQVDSSELRKKDEGEPQCPASIYISYTPDKQSLCIKKINDNHVHKEKPSILNRSVKEEKWHKKLQETKSEYVEIIKVKDEQIIAKDLEYKAMINELKTTVFNLESMVQDCKAKILNLEAQIYENDPETIIENEEVMWTEEIEMDHNQIEEIVEIPVTNVANQRNPIAFFDRDASVQRFFLLRWLLSAEKLIYVLNKNSKISEADISFYLESPEEINDSFMEARQELQLIYDDFEMGVLERFEEALERKIADKIYLCNYCGHLKDLNDWILCDGCLIWCHAKCIEVFAEVGGHFCNNCVKTIF